MRTNGQGVALAAGPVRFPFSTTRRRLLGSGGAALVAGVAAPPVVSLLGAGCGSPAADDTTADDTIVAYHDQSLVQHQARVAALISTHRPISLSTYGNRNAPLFAAVWMKPPLPEAAVFDPMPLGQLRDAIDQWLSMGRRPYVLSATGPSDDPLFVGAVASDDASPAAVTELNLNATEIKSRLAWCRAQKRIPVTLASWGTAVDPRYAATFAMNTGQVAWSADGLNEPNFALLARLAAQSIAWARPALVAVSPGVRYSSVFRDDQLGAIADWVALHDLTSSSYAQQAALHRRSGYLPVAVQAGGEGAATRFAAVFARQTTTTARVTTLRGTDTSPAVDQVMLNTMKRFGIRHAGLAVVKGRKLVYARALTHAEPDFAVLEPGHMWRLASVSKVLTAVATMQLEDTGQLDLSSRVQDLLRLRQPNGSPPVDARFTQITVKHLLENSSGVVDRFPDGFPNGNELLAVVNAFGASLPATKAQIASYMMTKPLAIAPGSNPGDVVTTPSNFGHFLLGLVVESLRATSLEAAVATHVGGPLGARRIARARTDSAATHEDARYRNPALTTALSNLTADRPLVPIQYGAEPLEIADASGGMAAALPDLAKVLASLNVREGNPVLSPTAIDRLLAGHYGLDRSVRNGSGVWHAWKGGLLMGSQTNVNFTQDGTSYVVAWGSNGVNDENDPSWTWFPEFPALDTAIASTSWSDVDRFPELGIPSF